MRIFRIVVLILFFMSGCGFKAPPYYEKPEPENVKSQINDL